MKTEELKAQGLTDEQIAFVMAENGKDIGKVQKKLEDMTIERDKESARATSAEETLKGFEGKDFDAITRERDEWQKKAEQAQAEFEKKEQARVYSDAVKASCDGLKFSSKSAEKAFIADLTAEGLSIKDGELLGFKDFVEKYKSADEGAFVKEEEENSAKFTAPQGAQQPKTDVRDADLRRAFGLTD